MDVSMDVPMRACGWEDGREASAREAKKRGDNESSIKLTLQGLLIYFFMKYTIQDTLVRIAPKCTPNKAVSGRKIASEKRFY